MDKYYSDENVEESRLERNKNKYAELNEDDLEKLDLTSNISVLGDNVDNLDIEELKELLNKKYAKEAKDVSIVSEEDFEIDLENTKEYDIKKFLEEANIGNKNDDYESIKLRKLKETQFEILNNLDLARKSEPEFEETLSEEETHLMNLIKTVNENSLKREKDIDLLSDLKGDDHTEVLAPIDMDMDDDYGVNKPTLVEELEKTIKLSKKDIESKLDTTVIEQVEYETDASESDEDLDDTEVKENTFYTGKFQIKDSDLTEFDELEREASSNSALVIILISILVLLVLAGAVYFADKFMNLGLFN